MSRVNIFGLTEPRKRLFMRLTILGALLLIFGTYTEVNAQSPPPTEIPSGIATLAVKKIDEHYLYASDAPWKKARREISNHATNDVTTAYAAIRSQLAATWHRTDRILYRSGS